MINKYFLAKMNIPAYLKNFLYDRYGYNEIEGIPPIIFKGNGKTLLDYRIFGASGGVGERTSNLFINVWFQGVINASTGIMETSSIFVCSDFIPITPLITYSCSRTVSREYNNLRCYDANKQYVGTGSTNANVGNPLNNGDSFGTFMITNESVAYIRFNDKSNDLTTKYMLVEGEYTASTMPDYEPYGYKVPVMVEGKNLAKNNYITISSSLSDLIVEKIGEFIHVSATNNTANPVPYVISRDNNFHAGTYDIVNNSDTMIAYDYKDENNNLIYNTVQSNTVKSFIFPESAQRGLNIYKAISSGVHIDNYFQVMIVKHGDDTDTYEPYIEPTTTNIYLDEPIGENESISLSDTNVNIPTIKGTNVLTVDTTIQPSKVLIKVGG